MPGLLKFAVYITIAIIIFFMFRKKEPKPSKLEMGLSKHRAKRVNKNALTGVRKVTAEVVDEEAQNRERSDLIYFKGKPFNMWQVLGIASGATAHEIKKAYAQKSSLDAENKELLSKAYKKAISIS